MGTASGELIEIYLENGQTGGRLRCPQNLIPSPGQYVLAHDPASDTPLPVPLFEAGSAPGGFLVAPVIPVGWQPGTILSLRGPLGRGFSMPGSARYVALVVLGKTYARLKPLLTGALEQEASVVLVSELNLDNVPPEVEIQPVAALTEVARWADYLALDLPRDSLSDLRGLLDAGRQAKAAQALIHTPMPCGGIAECGVCAVNGRRGWKLACKDGPVFDLKELI